MQTGQWRSSSLRRYEVNMQGKELAVTVLEPDTMQTRRVSKLYTAHRDGSLFPTWIGALSFNFLDAKCIS